MFLDSPDGAVGIMIKLIKLFITFKRVEETSGVSNLRGFLETPEVWFEQKKSSPEKSDELSMLNKQLLAFDLTYLFPTAMSGWSWHLVSF